MSANGRNGDGPEKCGATTKSGRACRLAAGFKTDHPGIGRCYFHFGSTPSGAKYAQRVAAERAVVTFGLPRDIDPWVALLELVHRSAGHVAWLGAQVAQEGTEALEAGSVWVELYGAERDRLARVSTAAMGAGVAERQVRIAEQQGTIIAEVIRAILGDLGVLDDPRVGAVVQRRLAAVAEATAIEA